MNSTAIWKASSLGVVLNDLCRCEEMNIGKSPNLGLEHELKRYEVSTITASLFWKKRPRHSHWTSRIRSKSYRPAVYLTLVSTLSCFLLSAPSYDLPLLKRVNSFVAQHFLYFFPLPQGQVHFFPPLLSRRRLLRAISTFDLL